MAAILSGVYFVLGDYIILSTCPYSDSELFIIYMYIITMAATLHGVYYILEDYFILSPAPILIEHYL